MNIIQKVIIIIASSIVAYIILYPPWIQTFQNEGISKQRLAISAPNSIFDPPPPRRESFLHGVEIDKDRLLAEVFLILVIGLAGYAITSKVKFPKISINKLTNAIKIPKISFHKYEKHIDPFTDTPKSSRLFNRIYINYAIFFLVILQFGILIYVLQRLHEVESVVEILTSVK